MHFDLDMGSGSNQIRGFTPGQVKINDTIYTHSVIVTPDKILPWDTDAPANLTETQLQAILTLKPDIVLIGSGETLIFPDAALCMAFHQQQIGFEVMNTAAACRTYNVIMAEGRYVAAALFI